MNNKIYIYNHGSKINPPSTVDIFPTEIISGKSIKELHDQILKNSNLFCVFTKLEDSNDIIVPLEENKLELEKILKILNIENKNIKVIKSSVYYTDKCKKNIIISDTANLLDNQLSSILLMYAELVNVSIDSAKVTKAVSVNFKNTKSEMYRVVNTRTSKVLIKVPKLEDAKRICNQNPCCVVMDSSKRVIHKSTFSKVPVPNKNTKTIVKSRSYYELNNGAKFTL